MKTLIKFILSFLLLSFSSCVTLYKPNTIHSPMLKEKGEMSTSASMGLSGSGLYNLQAAYAISNHTAIMVDGMYHNKNYNSDDNSTNEKLNILFGEAGYGYFKRFGVRKNGLLQCYSGGGYGFTSDKIFYENKNSPAYPEVSSKFYNVFIQPGVVFLSEYFDIAFDLKANYVRLFNINAYLYENFEWWNTDFQYHSNASLDFMNLEPNITMKAGVGKFKGILQLGLIVPTIHPKTYFNVNNAALLITPLIKISFGVNYLISCK